MILDRMIFPLLGILMLVSGCASVTPNFEVSVDSISGEGPIAKPLYVLLPGNKDTSESDLQFQEFAGYIKRALASKGYEEAESFEKADLAIFLGYGIGDPQEHQYTYSLPTWGQTGVSSSYTTGTISSYGGYSGTTTYTPTYGVTGATSHGGSYSTYFRFMLLTAYNLKEYRNTKKEVQVWKTTVTSAGSSGDLRRVFPVLVAASQDYVGTNTGNKIAVSLDEADARVMKVKGAVKNKSANGK